VYGTGCKNSSSPSSVGVVDLNVGELIMSIGFSNALDVSRLKAESVYCFYLF
jgi:hypothetical protein